ncbi:FAD-dependent oxidoreductase [Streptomyces iranensis]|uniref:ferredoxin--NADP(+) reductase n=1 Tax=Streptomyces iranensis TaxID=576784 RepID=A0A061A6C0_9ACTN|nr:FAD-dependent oxidoreductase [Streptomyces iranensis]MBP2063515.1 ferredoxin--NADP+ reductase [Streptomyces iranensis]CDR17909.1 NADPH-ferredoxin reductase [Streptomyces iranensis]
MTHLIVHGCCNDASCVPVCPVDCIHPTPDEPGFDRAEQLYIDPRACIDCGACLDACPADAVRTDLEITAAESPYVEINERHFSGRPALRVPPRPAPRFVDTPLRVAIVGAGPAGCYAAAALLEHSTARISMIDRLPTPHGLLRAGVAPDHQATKNVATYFDSVLSHPSVSCYFNVTVGEHIGLDELRAHHDAVIWAAGAPGDRELGIPGEDLPGCHSAREFVGWYNAHPDFVPTAFDLTGPRALVIGNGNVGLDVARMVVRDTGELAHTDMAAHALAALRASGIEEVTVAGRRGPEHAAYTLPELLALTQLDGVRVRTRHHEVSEACDAAPDDLALRLVKDMSSNDMAPAPRTIHLRYLLSPLTINGSAGVESVTFMRNELDRDASGVRLRPTGQTETIATNLVLKAVGYRGRAVPGLPFDEASGTIPHARGQIMHEGDPGFFCAGWIKRGPTGVIGSNKRCSLETVSTLLDVVSPESRDTGPESFTELVAARRIDYVDFAGWSRIRRTEEERGLRGGTPRKKFTAVGDMIAIARTQ